MEFRCHQHREKEAGVRCIKCNQYVCVDCLHVVGDKCYCEQCVKLYAHDSEKLDVIDRVFIKESTIVVNTSNDSFSFSIQVSGERVYVDVGDWSLLGSVGPQLGGFACNLRIQKNLVLVLSGKRVGQIQLRPDLQEFYTGLPDDFTIGMSYGQPLKWQLEKVKIFGVDFYLVSLYEIFLRKNDSISRIYPDRIGPPLGREADVVDHYIIMLTLDKKKAQKWALGYGLDNYVKKHLPDKYEQISKLAR